MNRFYKNQKVHYRTFFHLFTELIFVEEWVPKCFILQNIFLRMTVLLLQIICTLWSENKIECMCVFYKELKTVEKKEEYLLKRLWTSTKY